MTQPIFGRTRHGATQRALAALLVAVVPACDRLDEALRVEAPSQVPADILDHPENANFLVTGTISDFECALGAYVVNGGLLGNELRDATVTAARFPLDARTLSASDPYGTNSCTGNPPGIYRPLSTARWTAENALAKLNGWSDQEVANRTRLIATAAAYSGYSHLLLGEGFCTGVLLNPDLSPGREVDQRTMFASAEERFSQAITAAQAANHTDILNMAQLGRARARLNLGKKAEAAADARAMLARAPAYVKNAGAAAGGDPRRLNRVENQFRNGQISVDPSYRGLSVGTTPDPRVHSFDFRLGQDSQTRVWRATKYTPQSIVTPNEGAPLPIATFREAHLIIAEAEGGREAVSRINLLRGLHGLSAFSSANEVEIQQQVIEERRRELFLEGHHLNDLRRFNLALMPAPGSPFHQGGSYGEMRCFPLPDIERFNNPNL